MRYLNPNYDLHINVLSGGCQALERMGWRSEEQISLEAKRQEREAIRKAYWEANRERFKAMRLAMKRRSEAKKLVKLQGEG